MSRARPSARPAPESALANAVRVAIPYALRVLPAAEARLPAARREYELRLCVHTLPSGRAELRYFAGPRDHKGTAIALTARERFALAGALAEPGFHTVTRDDAPDLQLSFAI